MVTVGVQSDLQHQKGFEPPLMMFVDTVPSIAPVTRVTEFRCWPLVAQPVWVRLVYVSFYVSPEKEPMGDKCGDLGGHRPL